MKEETSNTEQSILKAAEKEFLKKGFSGSKTTEIAKEAGVTHAMLHYYFRTKQYAKQHERYRYSIIILHSSCFLRGVLEYTTAIHGIIRLFFNSGCKDRK